MSFITKRERVFNEHDLYDLPPRNEGKLKAYASCTDARAWSHFCSDKSEHLVEIIKRNNEVCRPKYVPTEAIVNALLAHKHAEIARLKRKIEEFEQMIAAYDDLDLSCEQKCEIAKAHATIKEANKDLHELWFDLDLSGYTGIDSEDFETGKSRGDEPSKMRLNLEEDGSNELGHEWYSEKELPQTESKGNQAGETKCICDASTNVVDPRIQEMKDVIIAKDAKLNAMRNTYAVIENDACEPYCIYAHIYTALEKIFGILCQNEKYKLYLNLMTAGKDIRGVDIKGRILFKLKVLEKFSLALLAPCSRDIQGTQTAPECSCYRAEIIPNIENAYALTSAEAEKPLLDNKRAQLVADIMENEEMKDLLNKDSKSDTEYIDVNDVFNIDQENLKRLKNLQQNYDDLMNCYDILKHEKDCLQIRCKKYEELEVEFQNLQTQLREYNSLWNEKEHYRKRSLDLDVLKEQYLVLSDETASLETELRAENEINEVKTKTIDELRTENVGLEKKINEAYITLEKERNCAQCKLKESECKIMCQGQQIKSLSIQIDRLLEQDSDKPQCSEPTALNMIDEMNSLKEQIKNLQDALFCTEEENQQLQLEFQNKLNLINDLKMEIEDWKSNYEKALHRNDYLEKYTNSFRDEVQKLVEENRGLLQEVEEKQSAIDNFREVINKKSQQIDTLMLEMEQKSRENSELYTKIRNLHDSYSKNLTTLDSEKSHAEQTLQTVQKESDELLTKYKDYDELVSKQKDLLDLYQQKNEELNRLQELLIRNQKENANLEMELNNQEKSNSVLRQEIQRLHEVNNFAANNISTLQEEKKLYKSSLEVSQKDSKILESRLISLEGISSHCQELKETCELLAQENYSLKKDLIEKTAELNNAIHTINLTRKESEELAVNLQSITHFKTEFDKVDEAYNILVEEQKILQSELDEKKNNFENLLKSYNNLENDLKKIKDQSSQEASNLSGELLTLKQHYDELLTDRNVLQNDFESKNDEINHLYHTLEMKIEENKDLCEQLQLLELKNKTAQDNINTLKAENSSSANILNALRKESEQFMDRIKYCEVLESNYNQLKMKCDEIVSENNRLQNELHSQKAQLRKITEDNEVLQSESQHLLSHSEDLERALINTRTELIGKTSSSNSFHMDIINEIEALKKEKRENALKIRDLYNKLDESENIILNRTEVIIARDDKITILENYVNDLQDEIRGLHKSLDEMDYANEQTRTISRQKITESLDNIEAHHSKATHNMKMVIAKLQNDKMKLEENVSINKTISQDSVQNSQKYMSQIKHLQNEREIITKDIKHLELKSVGDSILSPEHCDVDDILSSLDRIRLYIEVRNSKYTSLEQALQKVQDSYQLVQSKTDEAKKIVEKEKQKILNEKEEAVKDRINLEKQLSDLREQYEKQIAHDKKVIKDLEAEILNQNIICDKLNSTTQIYISNLKEEVESIKKLYQKSLENISELEKRYKLMSDENKSNLDIIESINISLQEKLKEIESLKKDLDNFKNKPSQSLGVQATMVKNRDDESQTNKILSNDAYDKYDDAYKMTKEVEYKEFNEQKSMNLKTKRDLMEQPKQGNEIQVLMANVEPSYDNFKNRYRNNKLKNLEQHSVSSTSVKGSDVESKQKIEQRQNKISGRFTNEQNSGNFNVIDIYNKQSIHTNSSKNVDSNYTENEKSPRSPGVSGFTDFNLTAESYEKRNNMHKASNLFGSVSGVSTDKDLFVIYKESEENKFNKRKWPENKDSQILVEAVTVHPDRYKSKVKQYEIDDTYSYLEDDEQIEDDSVKNKLEINLPRVDPDGPSTDKCFEYEKKSLEFFDIQNEISNDESKFLECNNDIIDEKQKHATGKREKRNKIKNDNNIEKLLSTKKDDSHHKLSRTEADVRLIRSKLDTAKNGSHAKAIKNENMASQFGLDYIHATADNIKTYNAAAALRRTQSDEMGVPVTFTEKSYSNQSRYSEENKTTSANKQSSYIITSKKKIYKNQEVMVNLDPTDDYERQIKNLTNNLANVEKDYKKKIDAIKVQYDTNIKNVLKEHNEGVRNIQGLHEDTLQDIVQHHENEVENLRSMSIEAMRKADRLEKEIQSLKCKLPACSSTCIREESIQIFTADLDKCKTSRADTKTLTKTNVEAFNVKPKSRLSGPCTCSLDINISDAIRNIFEQVDVDQRKIAEHTYVKYIANKILNSTVEALDCQELSFLHLKVCRILKTKLTKEESLQRRITSLEAEVLHKQRHNQHTMAELDKQVAEEKRRLQEVREAVCRNVPTASRYSSHDPTSLGAGVSNTVDVDKLCGCNTDLIGKLDLQIERKSAGDLIPNPGPRQKRAKLESNRATLVKLDADERRDRRLYNDEPPTRLRRSHMHPTMRISKK